MLELFHKIWGFMNFVKGFTVGYSITDQKMLFEYEGKRYVAEFREISNPKEDITDDMRRIKYL
jgi:hypothetical protein